MDRSETACVQCPACGSAVPIPPGTDLVRCACGAKVPQPDGPQALPTTRPEAGPGETR